MAELTVGGMIRSAFNHEAEGFGGETEALVAVALALVEINKNLEKLIEKGIKVKGQVTTWNGTDL